MLLLFVSVILPLGCATGPSCSAACDHLYGEDDCAIERPGRSLQDSHDFCMEECQAAVAQPGELGDYDPWTQSDRSTSVQLENRQQAQEWKACVVETSCEDLTDGYCAPVW